MFLIGFIVTVVHCVLGLAFSISRLVSFKAQAPVQSQGGKTKKKKKNKKLKNQRPKTLAVVPCYNSIQAANIMNSSTATLSDSRNSQEIAEYRISDEFYMQINDDHVLFEKSWPKFKQTSKWNLSDFLTLVAAAGGILQCAEVSD